MENPKLDTEKSSQVISKTIPENFTGKRKLSRNLDEAIRYPYFLKQNVHFYLESLKIITSRSTMPLNINNTLKLRG